MTRTTPVLLPVDLPATLRLRIFACELWRREIGEATVIEADSSFEMHGPHCISVVCEDSYMLDRAVASLRRSVDSLVTRRFCFAKRKKGKYESQGDFWARVTEVKRYRGTIRIQLAICQRGTVVRKTQKKGEDYE